MHPTRGDPRSLKSTCSTDFFHIFLLLETQHNTEEEKQDSPEQAKPSKGRTLTPDGSKAASAGPRGVLSLSRAVKVPVPTAPVPGCRLSWHWDGRRVTAASLGDAQGRAVLTGSLWLASASSSPEKQENEILLLKVPSAGHAASHDISGVI